MSGEQPLAIPCIVCLPTKLVSAVATPWFQTAEPLFRIETVFRVNPFGSGNVFEVTSKGMMREMQDESDHQCLSNVSIVPCLCRAQVATLSHTIIHLAIRVPSTAKGVINASSKTKTTAWMVSTAVG